MSSAKLSGSVIGLILVLLLVVGCVGIPATTPAAEAPAATPTPVPPTATPYPTYTLYPTYTPIPPTATPLPIATPSPPPAASSNAAPTSTSTAAPTTVPAPTPTLPVVAYYVAPTGNDSNPGTMDQPWQTIQKAADTLTAGDTVYIRAGTYRERIIPKNSGSPGSEITYAAYPGETATIDGDGITLPDDLAGLFEIAGRSYIRIAGLRVINAGPNDDNAGIMVLDSSNIIVENNSTYNTNSSGIGVWGSNNVTVDGNQIEEAAVGGWQECISVAGTDTFEVRNNEVLSCHKEGICIKDGSSNGQIYRNHVHHTRRVGIYVDAWDKHTHDIDVFQNVAFDSIESPGFAVASEQGGVLSRIRLENNIAYHNHTYGIEISRCCSANHPMDSIVIVNNTLYENGIDWGGGIIADNAQAQNVVIRNNVCSQNLTFQIAVAADVPTANVLVDHNLIDGYRGYEDEVYGDDYVQGDPQFEDPTNGNFHLRQGSPAVDAGSATDAPSVDFDGDSRPLDGDYNGTALPDIGADELAP